MLRRGAARIQTLDDALDFVFSFGIEGFRISPWQIRSEIRRLLELLEREAPRTLLEIGTASGGTLFLLSRVSRPDAMLLSIDLPGAPFGGGYLPARRLLYRGFARENQRIRLLEGDSHASETLDRVRTLLGGRELDFLFIDGDHSLEGVRQDLQLYSRFVRQGGLIALHDIVPGPAENVGDVPLFWRGLRQESHPWIVDEIVDSWKQRGAGIGLLRKS